MEMLRETAPFLFFLDFGEIVVNGWLGYAGIFGQGGEAALQEEKPVVAEVLHDRLPFGGGEAGGRQVIAAHRAADERGDDIVDGPLEIFKDVQRGSRMVGSPHMNRGPLGIFGRWSVLDDFFCQELARGQVGRDIMVDAEHGAGLAVAVLDEAAGAEKNVILAAFSVVIYKKRFLG